ncbi:hypothetical protein ACIQ7Q_34450 [Streptomyces sp. NPDC096176]|uniref:hypothetical protein n=1 Tax=Streptomyces sp. NPDC096176 TaxID=3366079 RepID=UPI003823BB37
MRRRTTQRTGSAPVLAAVRDPTRAELVTEAVRAVPCRKKSPAAAEDGRSHLPRVPTAIPVVDQVRPEYAARHRVPCHRQRVRLCGSFSAIFNASMSHRS